ncbi:heterokaryon incompatibility protein-domain-containing protein [Cladorrhinum sp. PSN259]|nr:heterokaryon incompatibility protein-domain-containing protein [Cladorrhinum sp. PSN259]
MAPVVFPPPPSGSCPACNDHRLYTPWDEKRGAWHGSGTQTLATLRKAAPTCGLCNAVVAVFDRMKAEDVDHPDELEILFHSRPGWPMRVTWPSYNQMRQVAVPLVEVEVFTPSLELPPTTSHANSSGEEVHMAIHDPLSEPWPIIARRPPVSAHSGAEDALLAAKRFIEKCRKEHGDECNAAPQGSFLPTRLLDVRGFQEGRCQIWKSKLEGTEASPPYVALSYCWGGDQPHKTTMNNLGPRTTDGFDISILPLTIREAVQFTFLLGIPYIWIDSLCIVQDDHADWAREASQMGGVYESAALTIAADNSPTASSGLFQQHSLGESVPLTIPGPGGKLFEICARRHKGLCQYMVSLDDSDTKNPNVKVKPLATRGWTLQERMLSSRIIHFTNRELEWECRKTFLCECQGPQPKNRRSLVSTNVLYDLSTRRREFDDAWASVVENFSRRNLTYESDKLPALTGLIQRMSGMYWSAFESGSRRCLSGLWECDIGTQLCWYTGWDWPGRPRARQSPDSKLPSWSWASIGGPVQLWKTIESCIKFVSYRSRGDDTGDEVAVNASEVTLRGLVAPIQMRYRPERPMNGGMVVMQASSVNHPSDYRIRPLGLANRMQNEVRPGRASLITRASLAGKDEELLTYIALGERGFQLDYTSKRVQPSSWEDRGYVALIVGDHTGSEHDKNGKYVWGVKFSHWMLLAPVKQGGADGETERIVYERLGMIMKSSLHECHLRPEAVEREITLV